MLQVFPQQKTARRHIQVPIGNILPVDADWQIDPALSGSFSVGKGNF